MNNSRSGELARIALLASMYVALSLAIAPLTFGAVQFRFAEMLMLFVVFNRKYAISMILGCFIVNIFSPLGYVDMIVGTSATALACLAMFPVKNIWIASIFPTLSCILIGVELYFLTGAPLLLTCGTVMLGEFVVVTCLGCPLMKLLLRNKTLVKLLGFDRNLPTPKPPKSPCAPPDFASSNDTPQASSEHSDIGETPQSVDEQSDIGNTSQSVDEHSDIDETPQVSSEHSDEDTDSKAS